jgi:hypothetical protein
MEEGRGRERKGGVSRDGRGEGGGEEAQAEREVRGEVR